MEIPLPKVNRKLLTPTFLSLWTMMFLIEFVKGALLVSILPVYMGDVLGLSALAIGLSFSTQYIGDNLFRAPAGWLISRIGFRLAMTLGISIMLIAVLLIAFTHQIGYIVLGCALLGAGTSPLWPCVMLGVSSVTEKNQNFATAMGVIQISSLGGTGLGPVLINFLVGISYALVFSVLLGCIGAVLLISLALPGVVKEAEEEEAPRRGKVNTSRPFDKLKHLQERLAQTIGEVRRNIHVSRLLYPALFLQSFAVGLLTPVITLFVRTELGLSPEQFSLMLIVGGGFTVLGLIPVGRLVDQWGTTSFLNAGFALAAVSIGLFAYAKGMPGLLVWGLVILIGASYACILPSWNTMVSTLLPKKEKGAVWGFFLAIQGTGMVIGPVVSGRLWDFFGPHAPFLASAGAMSLLFLIHLRLSHKNVRRDGQEALPSAAGRDRLE